MIEADKLKLHLDKRRCLDCEFKISSGKGASKLSGTLNSSEHMLPPDTPNISLAGCDRAY